MSLLYHLKRYNEGSLILSSRYGVTIFTGRYGRLFTGAIGICDILIHEIHPIVGHL
jgi:hypothetical protein